MRFGSIARWPPGRPGRARARDRHSASSDPEEPLKCLAIVASAFAVGCVVGPDDGQGGLASSLNNLPPGYGAIQVALEGGAGGAEWVATLTATKNGTATAALSVTKPITTSSFTAELDVP